MRHWFACGSACCGPHGWCLVACVLKVIWGKYACGCSALLTFLCSACQHALGESRYNNRELK